MSADWKVYSPKLPLYDVLTKGGGVTVEHALRRAESMVENFRGRAGEALEKELSALEALVNRREPEPADAIYKSAMEILNVSSMFQAPLCRAANSLCELVSRMRAAQRWDWASVDVHVASMRALLGKRDEKDPGVASVLKGLGALVGRFPEAPSEAEAARAPSA